MELACTYLSCDDHWFLLPKVFTLVFRLLTAGFVTLAVKLQYGPIVDIDLKIPPRPPGYAFIEVSFKFVTYFVILVKNTFAMSLR